jgi:hypothetical protein
MGRLKRFPLVLRSLLYFRSEPLEKEKPFFGVGFRDAPVVFSRVFALPRLSELASVNVTLSVLPVSFFVGYVDWLHGGMYYIFPSPFIVTEIASEISLELPPARPLVV